MRTGKTPLWQLGYSYVWLLLFLAITSAGLAHLGQLWASASQRERERELMFRGQAYANAIRSYMSAGGGLALQNPNSLDDLLLDRRGAKERTHIRRLYADPFTGAVDWVLVPSPSGQGFIGVKSRAKVKRLIRQADDPAEFTSDLVFGGS